MSTQNFSSSYEQLKAENERLKVQVASQQRELAKDETIFAAKDAVIAAKDELLAMLKQSLLTAQDELLMSKAAHASKQHSRAPQAQSKAGTNADESSSTEFSLSTRCAALQLGTAPQEASDPSYEPPLKQDAILQFIFCFVGLRDYFFVASISRRWRGRYLTFCRRLRVTHYTAAVTMPHRLMLAFMNGLTAKIYDNHFNFAAAVVTTSSDPVSILQMCRVKGMPWTPAVTNAAASCGNLSTLQQLIAFGCP